MPCAIHKVIQNLDTRFNTRRRRFYEFHPDTDESCSNSSGEALKGKREYGIDPDFIVELAREIHEVHQLGVQIGVVIGGSNIFRGASEPPPT